MIYINKIYTKCELLSYARDFKGRNCNIKREIYISKINICVNYLWIFKPFPENVKNHLRRIYTYEISALQYLPSHFSSSLILNPFFFHVVASNPSQGLLTRIEDRFAFRSDHVGETEDRSAACFSY